MLTTLPIISIACLFTGSAMAYGPPLEGQNARGNSAPHSCVGVADGKRFCQDLYRPGYFGSGITDAYCDGQNCVVACKPGWKCANGKDGCLAIDGEYHNFSCVNGPDTNICKDFFSADSTGCVCHGDPGRLQAEGVCGCLDGKEMGLNDLNQAACPA